jgi:hypothetical protein
VMQAEIDKLVENLDEEELVVPAMLRERIEKVLKARPAESWDTVLREMAEQEVQK